MQPDPRTKDDPITEDDVPPAFEAHKPSDPLTRTSCYVSLIQRIADAIEYPDRTDADKVLKAVCNILEGDGK